MKRSRPAIIALRLVRFAGVLAATAAHDVFFLKMRKAGSTSMLELLTAAAEHPALVQHAT